MVATTSNVEKTIYVEEADKSNDKLITWGLGLAIGLPSIFLIGSIVVSHLPH